MAADEPTRPGTATSVTHSPTSADGHRPASDAPTEDGREQRRRAATVTVGLWPMMFVGGVNLVDQIDMAILRGILPILEDVWSLSDLQLGLLGFVFVLVNAVATIPAGWLADNVRRTRIVGWTMASWTGLLALSATAVNYLNLLFARTVMGIGQSFDDPATTSLLGDYYPPNRRATAFSIQQLAFFAGGGLGVALGGFVGEALGWRWAFVLVGMPGSLLAVAAFRLREPVRGEMDLLAAGLGAQAADDESPDGPPWRTDPSASHPPVSAKSAASAGTPSKPRQSFGRFLKIAARDLGSELRFVFGIRTMRYVLIGVSALLFTVSGIAFWLAVYHERFSGMTVTQATAVTALVFGIGGTLGTLGGGRFGDRVLGSRGPASRIHIAVGGATTSAVVFMISFAVEPIPLRLLLQSVGVVTGAAAVPGLRAAMLDVVPAESRGVGASAFSLTSIVFGTALAPPLVGVLSDATGSLVTAFYLVFPPVILGLLLLLRATKTIVADAQQMIAALVSRQAQSDGQQGLTAPDV